MRRTHIAMLPPHSIVASLSISVFFAVARYTCESGRALTHTFVQAPLTPRRSGFDPRASRPTRRRPRHSLYRTARAGSSPQDRTAARIHVHTCLALRAPLEGGSAQSPPTSFEAGYDDEEAGSPRQPHATRRTGGRRDEDEDEGGEEHFHDTPAPHAWYKPSVPVLLALAPPIGNWLTGGDHVKDLLLLLLLVFYLHRIVEVPWSFYHAARPRRPPAPRDADPDPAHIPALRARRAARAQSALRTLELGLLLLCLITPLLGVTLLRSLASPLLSVLVLFSTALFGLATALRPLRELVSRIVSRTSTLHSQVHAHPARSSLSSRDKNGDAESTQAQLAALRAQVARLELAVAQLAATRPGGRAVRVVRRVERRVGRLRAGRKELEGAAQSHSSKTKTVFVPAQPKPPHTTAFALVSSWFCGSPAQPPPPPHTTYVPPPLSPTNGNGNGTGKRRALDSIPEEEGGDVPLHVLPHPRHTHPAYTPAHADVDAGAGGTLLPLLRAWLAACVALALYPLYVVLKPVRGVGRVVGVGVGGGGAWTELCRLLCPVLPYLVSSPRAHPPTLLRPGCT
ncbi:hypothetical protein B0H14DRAFT_3175693 [Mycena olivaceomarginata]|nr:hypothetical protein B0H14DRAFT_3175693 [Mycena olivaceomarginata]